MTADSGNVTYSLCGPGFHGEPGWSLAGTTMAIESDWGKASLKDLDPGVRSRRRHGRRGAARHRRPTGRFRQRAPVLARRHDDRVHALQVRPSQRDLPGQRGRSGLKRLTRYKLNASRPDVSPDGAGSRSTPGTQAGLEQGNIYVMRLEGGKKKALTQSPPSRGRSPLRSRTTRVSRRTGGGSSTPSSAIGGLTSS